MKFVSTGRSLFNLPGGLASWPQCNGGGGFPMEFASIGGGLFNLPGAWPPGRSATAGHSTPAVEG
jgi:hypothetical protein